MSQLSEVDEPARLGQRKIAWAKTFMPILAASAETLEASKALKDKRIAICLPLDAKVANLALRLLEHGAEVACCASIQSTDVEVAEALRQNGIPVLIVADASADTQLSDVEAFLSISPNIILDHDAWITHLAYTQLPAAIKQLSGVTEQTKTGLQKLRALSNHHKINAPVVNLNNTQLNTLFHNTVGVGQAAVMALLDVTNLQIAGRKVLVIGYGSIGKGIAQHAKAMGARVSVAEIDPIKAMQAQYDGHAIEPISQAAPQTEVVFQATIDLNSLTVDHVNAMPNGVIICSSTHSHGELAAPYLENAESCLSVRADVTEYQFSNGKNVLLIAQGHRIHLMAGEGCSIEIADMLMALQLMAIDTLISPEAKSLSGIIALPHPIEEQIAMAHLNLQGVNLNN